MKQNIKSNQSNSTNSQGTDDEMLSVLQQETFAYFLKEVNNKTGLVADKTQPVSRQVLQATGMGLSCYITGVEH